MLTVFSITTILMGMKRFCFVLPWWLMCYGSFHMLIDHLCIIFGEMSIQILYPFFFFYSLLNWVICLLICSPNVHYTFGAGAKRWHREIPRLGVKVELQLPVYITAHGNSGSLTHWVGPGIEPASSWILVSFISAELQWELLLYIFFFKLGVT